MNNELANHLRKWGLKVVEVAGWQNRGASGAFEPRAVLVHHTAAGGTKDAPSLGIVTNGRTGIPGPLSQFVLGRSGTVYVVAGGRANHAGVGGPIAGIPKDAGNRYAWGIEAENNGIGEKWPEVQLQAYYRLCAALAAYSKFGPASVIAHREWATPAGRKSDPAGINMTDFRARVANAIKAGPAGVPVGDPVLRLGDEGQKVTDIQNALVKHQLLTPADVDGDFGPTTEKAVNAFKKRNGWPEDGVCGQRVWDGLRKPYLPPAPAPAPTPAPVPAPAPAPVPTVVVPPANLATPTVVLGGDRVLVQFTGDNHVWEVVGSKLYHVTFPAWQARGLTSAMVTKLDPAHPLNSLVKVKD